jgi:hypothetical protein
MTAGIELKKSHVHLAKISCTRKRLVDAFLFSILIQKNLYLAHIDFVGHGGNVKGTPSLLGGGVDLVGPVLDDPPDERDLGRVDGVVERHVAS